MVGAVALRGLMRTAAVRAAAGEDGGRWERECVGVLARTAMLAGFTLVALDLLRLWHQTYAFYGGFEPITLGLVRVIANDTLWGSGWRLQALSAAAAGVAFAAVLRSWPLAWAAATAAVFLAAVARPLTGHAVEQGSWFSLPAILQAVHVTGAALWLGTLLALRAVAWRRALALPGERGAELVAALVRGFSPLALGAAAALFVAGCATSFQYLGGPQGLYATAYGRVLAAKILAFGAVVGLGYFNWRRVKPRIEAGSAPAAGARALLLRSATAELGMAAAVLLLTAVLVALPMPAG